MIVSPMANGATDCGGILNVTVVPVPDAFNVVTELTYKKDDEEFRPDVILLINGMPLVFIEVQRGSYFGEDDIVRLNDIYGRG